MSAGRLSEGVGYVTWWGFSPARDLLSLGKKTLTKWNLDFVTKKKTKKNNDPTKKFLLAVEINVEQESLDNYSLQRNRHTSFGYQMCWLDKTWSYEIVKFKMT